MRPKLPPSFKCEQCGAILNELVAARSDDERERRRHAKAAAAASGRDPDQFARSWVDSVAEMPDDETRSLLTSQYPRVTDARKKKTAHEAETGHSVVLHGWQFLRSSTEPW